MSAAYWSAVLEHLPEAAVVFDKFHILKLMNERLDDLRRQMVREAEGPLKLQIKDVLLAKSALVSNEHLPQRAGIGIAVGKKIKVYVCIRH